MKNVSSLLILLLIGSLWGIVEILPIATFWYCALGILFLTIGRSLVPVFGTSVMLGLLVCLFKTASASFMVCQWAGVLSLAVSYEAMVYFVNSRVSNSTAQSVLSGMGAVLLALPIFVVWVTLIAKHPYWIAGGWDRIIDYAVYTSAAAMLLSAVLAPVGRLIGESLAESELPQRAFSMWISGVAIVLSWSIALFV